MESQRSSSGALLALCTGAAIAAAYQDLLRPELLQRGATDEEMHRPLPGDDLVPEPALTTTHAVTIDAPPSAVWPWLLQMGPGRAGAYTYDWIENLFGLNMHSADRIVPEWQHMAPGDAFNAGGKGPPLRVEQVDPERTLLLALPDRTWSWVFALEPVEGGRTRLIERNRFPVAEFGQRLRLEVMLPGAYLMERKMLLGIKQRAERAAGATSQTPPVADPVPLA